MILDRTSKDITYTSDGDFMLNPNGGIQLSSMDNLQLLSEVIYRRLSSSLTEWSSNYAVAANLRSVIGENLNSQNVALLSEMIRSTLTAFSFLDDNEVALSPAIVSGTNVNISVGVKVSNAEKIFISILYDTRDLDFEVKFLDQKAV